MSLADLSSALGNLQFNPTFNLGLGLMSASGPSLMPHSFGQDLAKGVSMSQQARLAAIQARMAELQAQRYGLQNSAISGVLGNGGMGSGTVGQGGGDFATPDQARAASAQLAPPGAAPNAPMLSSSNGTPGTSYADPNQQPSAAPSQGSHLADGMAQDPMFKLGFAFDPSAASAQYLSRAYPQPTDFVKQLDAAGIDPQSQIGRQLLRQNIAKQNYIAPTSLRGGGYMYDPQTGGLTNLPTASTGFQVIRDPVTGQFQEVPVAGGLQAVGASEAAKAGGSARYQLKEVWEPSANNGRGGYVQQSVANVADAANGASANAPLGIRNNNPGNLRPGGNFAQYPDMQTGMAALDKELQSYGKQGVNTISDVISKWAPPNENDTAGYIKDVSQRLGVAPTQRVDLSNPLVRQSISTAIALHENGPQGVFGSASQSGPMASQAPLGTEAATDTAQNAPSQQMRDSYSSLSNADASYQQSREALSEMLNLAKNKGVTGGALGLLPSGVATRISTDAATYQKLHATYVALQGKALGSGGTDAARETIDEAVPTYDKPQQAMLNGLTTQLNNLDIAHLKTQFLSPLYQSGDEKSYTQKTAAFDRNITPNMAPILRLSGEAQRQAVAQAIKQDPSLKPRFEWAYNNGMLQ
jgi:hypothetical protein